MLAAQERFHESSRFTWLEQVWQDLRYAARSLVHSRVFSAATVLTLAVALGLSTVVFTIFNAYVLRPFAVREPYSLFEIRWQTATAGGRTFSWRDLHDLRARDDVFDGVLAERAPPCRRQGDGCSPGSSSRATTSSCSGPACSSAGPSRASTHGAGARSRRRAEPSGVGAPVRSGPVGRRPDARVERTAVPRRGRHAARVRRSRRVPVRPLAAADHARRARRRRPPGRQSAASTGADRTPPPGRHARAGGECVDAAPEPRAGQGRHGVARICARRRRRRRSTWDMLAVLSPVFAAFVLVLVTACANVSNMMLARANARHREIGVRLSLGASRGRVVRQLLTEGLLLAGLACLVALAVAALAMRVGPVRSSWPRFRRRWLDWSAWCPSGSTSRVPVRLRRGRRHDGALRAAASAASHAAVADARPAWRGRVGVRRVEAAEPARRRPGRRLARAHRRRGNPGAQRIAAGATDLGFTADGVLSVNHRIAGASIVPRAADLLTANPRVGDRRRDEPEPDVRRAAEDACPARRLTGHVVPTTYQYVSPEFFPLLEHSDRPRARFPARGSPRRSPRRHHQRVRGQSAVGRRRSDRQDRAPGLPEDRTELGRGASPRARGGPADPEPPGTSRSHDRRRLEGHREHVRLHGRRSPRTSTFPRPPPVRTPRRCSSAPHRALGVDRAQMVLRRAHENPLALEVIPLVEMLAIQLYPLQIASWIGSLLGVHCARPEHLRPVWRAHVHAQPARPRDWHPHGARRDRRCRRSAHHRSGSAPGRGRRAGRTRHLVSVLQLLSSLIRLQNVTVLDLGRVPRGRRARGGRRCARCLLRRLDGRRTSIRPLRFEPKAESLFVPLFRSSLPQPHDLPGDAGR